MLVHMCSPRDQIIMMKVTKISPYPIRGLSDDENNQRVTLKRFGWIRASSPRIPSRKFGGLQCIKTSILCSAGCQNINSVILLCFAKLTENGGQKGTGSVSGFV